MVAPVVLARQFAAHLAPLFRHTCSVTRAGQARDGDDAPAFDAYGEAVGGDYAPVAALTGVRCFAWRSQGTGDVQEPARALVAHDWRAMLLTGTTVYEGDRLVDVLDEANAAIVAGPLQVVAVVPRRGHTLLLCTEIGLASPQTVEEAP